MNKDLKLLAMVLLFVATMIVAIYFTKMYLDKTI